MKFKFCGDRDCPLWALAGIHSLSTIPPPVFRSLLDCVIDGQNDDDIMKIIKDANSWTQGTREEAARAAAVIRWLLTQTWSHECSGAQLSRDLLVLGAPRTLAGALQAAADDGREAYRGAAERSYMVNRLTDVSASPGPEGSIDTIKLTLHTDDAFTGDQSQRELLLEKSQAKELLCELKKAYQRMEELGAV